MSHYTVTVPVKPYIRKFVNYIEGDPILSSDQSRIWMIIRPCLEKSFCSGLSKKQIANQTLAFTDKITIHIPISKMRLYGHSVSVASIILINRILENDFERELSNYVERSIRDHVRYKGYKEALFAFAYENQVDLEEDISFDGLKKIEYRYRTNIKKICSTVVPSPKHYQQHALVA